MGGILDVRALAPKDRHAGIFGAFKDLAPGDYFVLVNDHDPKPLLYQFQAEHDNEFEWWPLERGTEVWRVIIAKREAKDTHRTVTDYLQTDHRRLDAIFERFSRAVKDGRWEEASKDFREFSLGLKRHIGVEEEILFPVFEEKTGMKDSGPTFVMREEHKDIKALLDSILSGTDAKNPAAVAKGMSALTNTLGDHNMKEEQILYPESDHFLSDAERSDVIKRAQAA
ncbi:MAG: DUF2249 domain-containing protein [Deltaproteobacteria bacterium]|nr:DUF2249 domain-containing protein [Deltaproteobacteria bacterium]